MRGSSPGTMQRAVLFTDLASFTPLTDAMGDAEAAAVIARFSLIAREVTAKHEGRVVKQIGDEFMLVFPDVARALRCALDIESATKREPSFPAARSGLNWGDVLYREGDYLGTTVNVASRLAGEAGRHQVLLTGQARRRVRGDEFAFARLGARRLRGVAEEIELFEARPHGPPGSGKIVDIVCGMEMAPAEVAARLTFAGREFAFCSDNCLRLYVAAPERYGASPSS